MNVSGKAGAGAGRLVRTGGKTKEGAKNAARKLKNARNARPVAAKPAAQNAAVGASPANERKGIGTTSALLGGGALAGGGYALGSRNKQKQDA
jgi:hypothetical protein